MSLTPPNPIIKPFCNSGTQVTPPVGADTFVANQETGFPDSQATPLPVGTEVQQDQMNGILKFYTSLILWLNSGGQFTFNQTFSDANNGYAKDNILWCESTSSFQRSLIDNNTANFVTNPSYIDDGIHWISMNPLIVANNSARAYYTGNSNNITNPARTFAYLSEIPLVFADNVTRACYTGGGTSISNPAKTFAYISELPQLPPPPRYRELNTSNVGLQIHAVYDPIAMIWLCSCSGRVTLSSNGTANTAAIIDLSGIVTILKNNFGTVGGFAGVGNGLAIESTNCEARTGTNDLIMYIKWNQAINLGNNMEYTFSIVFTASSII